VPEVPPQILKIAGQLGRNERVNRRSIATLLEWFGAARRGSAVVAEIRAALLSAGLETDPDFTHGNTNDYITFCLIGEAEKAVSPAAGLDKPVQARPIAEATGGPETSHSDEPSDDFLEPEADDDERQVADDDRPVVSQPADWIITVLREQKEAGLLDLQPPFQRQYVWGLKPELPSRLIESVLLEIPIPPLYFGKLAGGKLEVIDGQQRLTTFINFIKNEFALRRLIRMPSLNGKKFCDLSTEYQEKIKRTPIRTVMIDAGNNNDLRYEIFERLNRGSMGLNEQELRNCVYRGKFNELLAALESDSKWRIIKGGDPEPRFKEREMILRFFALANRIDFYTGGLKRFLNDYMENYAPKNDVAIKEQELMFLQTMRNVYTVFGLHSGRLYSIPPGSRDGRWDTKFSIAALEIQASALLGQEPARVQKVADQIQEHFLFLLLTDKAMKEAISQHTGGSAPTKLRWTKFKSIIQPLLANVVLEPRFFDFQFRKQLYDKNPICAICRNQIHSLEDSTVDHIIPYSKGGKTVPKNGQLSHRSCNAIKNATVPGGVADTE
jgi:hypothetical protein